MNLTLVTPEKKLFTDLAVEELVVPALAGELNILPGHAPLVTALDTGVMRYRLAGSSEELKAAVSSGYCEVLNDQVTILADIAELPEEIDKARAETVLAESDRELQRTDLPEEEHNRFALRKKRSEARLAL